MNTDFASDYDLDPDALFLPTLRGFGTIADLHIAMSQDEDLLDMVEEFVLNWSLEGFSEESGMEEDFQQILLTWAGVADIDPDSRSSGGADIDARHIAFLEKFFDTPFIQHGRWTDPMHMAADKLEEAYTIISDNYRAQLLVQLGVGDLFGGTLSYDPWEGK